MPDDGNMFLTHVCLEMWMILKAGTALTFKAVYSSYLNLIKNILD